jgi:calnexin
MQNDILFDNIYIGHSEADAEALKKETFDLKIAAEKAVEEATKPKADEPIKSPSELVFKDDPVLYMKEKVNLFIEVAKRDGPVEAVKFVPEVAGAAGGLLALVLSLLFIIGGGAAAAPSAEQVKAQAKKAKDVAVDAKDKAAEAVATGAEKAQAEVNKRTTRSNAS